ncbi:MAG: hypothetical protein JWO78_2467 [Micavibrio sp.]|nr:hypothetical protein [Micavibrio sp.]
MAMFRNALTKLDTVEAHALLTELNPQIDGSPYQADKATVLSAPVSFYPGYQFIEISDHTIMPARKTALIYKAGDAGSAVMLDWTNKPIYALNDNAPLTLDESTINDYVRFFFSYVRGRHGRFVIIENVDEISWKDEPPVNARKAVSSLIAPLHLYGIDNDGTYRLSARMLFKDSLFKADIVVDHHGHVNLEDEELVIEDIPVVDEVLG